VNEADREPETVEGSEGRPLWQILLTLFLAAYALYRGLAAGALFAAGAEAPSFAIALAAQAVMGAVAAIAMWLGRPWVVGALIAFGVTVAATSLLNAFVLGVRPAAAAVAEVVVAGIATAALALAMRHEFSRR
jgi:hypothetical protein